MLDFDFSKDSFGFNRQTIVMVILVILLFLLIYLASYLARRGLGLNRRYYQKKWQEVLHLSKLSTGSQLAIIEADKLVDEVLKRRYFKGKTMGERLVSASKVLKDQDAVWSAHKLRNRLVHETRASFSKKQLQIALDGFQKALKDLGAL